MASRRRLIKDSTYDSRAPHELDPKAGSGCELAIAKMTLDAAAIAFPIAAIVARRVGGSIFAQLAPSMQPAQAMHPAQASDPGAPSL